MFPLGGEGAHSHQPQQCLPPTCALWPHSTPLWHPTPFSSKAAALGAAPCPQFHPTGIPMEVLSPPPQKKRLWGRQHCKPDLLPKNSSKKSLFSRRGRKDDVRTAASALGSIPSSCSVQLSQPDNIPTIINWVLGGGSHPVLQALRLAVLKAAVICWLRSPALSLNTQLITVMDEK